MADTHRIGKCDELVIEVGELWAHVERPDHRSRAQAQQEQARVSRIVETTRER
jgi:head-tail adaptor